MYDIEFSESVEKELSEIRQFHRNIILDGIEKQLSHQPDVETRNRKMLENLIPTFKAVPPIWELRIGEYRVFYDIGKEEKKVFVRAIRKKPPHLTTEEIL